MQVRWTRQALAELDGMLSHATDRDPLEASNIRRRVEKAIRTIETFPQAAYHDAERGYFEKVVPRTRIILIYQLEQAEAVIFAVFHSSQNVERKPSSR